MAARYREKIFTTYDEWGLLTSLERLPGETLIEFRERLLNHDKYDSTAQGLLHYVADSCLSGGYNITTPKEFFSLRQPLSFSQYQTLTDPTEDYYAPRVTVGSTTWILEPTADKQKDSMTSDGYTWALWKQPNGVFDRVWTASDVPVGDVVLRYQWADQDGSLHTIHESSKLLTWEDGTITETYPPELL